MLLPGEEFYHALAAFDTDKQLTANVDTSVPDVLMRTLSAMSDLSDRMLNNIVDWAKKVPGK